MNLLPAAAPLPCSQGGSKLLDGARSARRTIQNNLLDRDKQEALELLVWGGDRGSDFRDRARLVLPSEYHHGRQQLLGPADDVYSLTVLNGVPTPTGRLMFLRGDAIPPGRLSSSTLMEWLLTPTAIEWRLRGSWLRPTAGNTIISMDFMPLIDVS